MTIERTEKSEDHPYTRISNKAVQDKSLSWKARGLLAYLLSLPDDWEINQAHLEDQAPDGSDSISTAMQELRKAGYVKREVLRNENGHFQGYEYTVRENGNSESGMTDPGESDSGKTNQDPTNTTTEQSTHSTQNTKNNKQCGFSKGLEEEEGEAIREIDETLRQLGVHGNKSNQLTNNLWRKESDQSAIEEFLEAMRWEIESNGKRAGFVVWAIKNYEEYNIPSEFYDDDSQVESDVDYPDDPDYDWEKYN